MEVEQAIKTAIEYEIKVSEIYAFAVKESRNETAKRVFKKLADEEEEHIKYLKTRLTEWRKSGNLTLEKLLTAIPAQKSIEEGIKKLDDKLKEPDKHGEAQMLTKALDVEIETSKFYDRMVKELDAEPQKMFQRFLEIEEGHLAIVQAELDALQGNGFWFDFQEFSVEH